MKFEGNLEHLQLVRMNKIIKVLEEHGFTADAIITVQPIGQKGDNYVACMQRISVEDKDGKTLKMIAKLAPSQEMIRQMMQMEMLFSNEVIMYTEILPKLLELQNNRDVSEEGKLKFPICYGTITEAPHEMILLEDLKTKDFDMRDRMISLTNEEILIVLERLATLHSVSFALRNKEPELFVEYSSKLRNMWTSDILNDFAETYENGMIQLLDDDDCKSRTRGTVTKLQAMGLELQKSDLNSRYSVVIHGDCWTNNLMFRFEVSIKLLHRT